MSGWVIDSSLALAWALPDERSNRADAFWDNIAEDGELHIPVLWWYEVVNAVVVARRRQRLNEATATEVIGLLGRLPLEPHLPAAGSQVLSLQAIAHQHELSAYDAAYLELALRLEAGLATLDERLAEAGRSAGISVWAG